MNRAIDEDLADYRVKFNSLMLSVKCNLFFIFTN